MKKTILIIVLCAFMLPGAMAQLSVGVKGGLTMANLSFDRFDEATVDYSFGGHAAAFLKIGKGIFSFQPEFMYIQKGTRINSTVDASYSQLSMNYFDVPLLARFSVGIKIVEIYANLGPYGGYWFSGKTKNHYYDITESKWKTDKEDYEFDDDHDVRYDVGVVGGVGVKVLMFIFEVRYGQGFIDVFDSEMNDDKETNRYLNFTLGVQL